MKNVILTIFLLSSSLLAGSYWELKKSTMSVYKSGDKQQAIAMVKDFIKKNPNDYKAQNLEAVYHYWSGEHKQAQVILENILSHTKHPEAAKLLKRVNSKIGKTAKVTKQRTYKSVRKANKRSDLEYLVAQVEKNPQDIENRVLLSKFYFKIEEYQKSYDLAYEVLAIEPNNKKMKTIKAHLETHYKLSYSAAIEGSAIDKVKAKSLLKKLHHEKKYDAYMNLYESLKNAQVSFTKEDYVDILHASIMVEKYQVAKEIISSGFLPINKQILKVQLLLSKKLARTVARK